MAVKHVARTPLAVASASRAQAPARNSQLRAQFLARPAELLWPETMRTLQDTARRRVARRSSPTRMRPVSPGATV
jgi:hypothetical protein